MGFGFNGSIITEYLGYRFMTIIGGQLRSKHREAWKREALIGCSILNRMLELAWPVSYQVC